MSRGEIIFYGIVYLIAVGLGWLAHEDDGMGGRRP